MASRVSTLVFLVILAAWAPPAFSQSSEPSEPMCYDWGESSEAAVSVLEGEAGWLSCPLFSHPSVYNYSSTQSTGHNLFWYRLPEGHDLEQPITYSSRLSKDRERLWLQPATADDMGQYICMLRNKSSCSKIAMRLRVLQPDEAGRGANCPPQGTEAVAQEVIPQQEGKTLDCPDLQDATKMADSDPTVTWYHVRQGPSCSRYPFWNTDRQQEGARLIIYVMLDLYKGVYMCTVQYQRKGKALNFTRSINVTAVYPSSVPKNPTVLHPNEHQVFTVRQDTEVHLVCRGLFPYLDSPGDIWWTVDGKTLDKLSDRRFNSFNRQLKYDYGDRTMESTLVIQNFQSEDLRREYNCSVRNQRGFETRRAQLEEEVSLPSVELGCGLGVTLVLMLLLFVIYHIFWLELLLLYRSWFGTDERHTDDKEYDVYISYARNSEEEQFVLSTLRRVLENELGYSVCIFDRDSLPGGNLSETILQSMQRSRRLLFVLSPDFLAEKSFSLLECRLGLYLQHGYRASVIAVVFRSVSKLPCVEVTQLRQAAVSTVSWRGSRSEPRRSRFWLRLRLALPVRPLALGRRLIDSTSSHSDLAALALQRAQRNQNHIPRVIGNQNHRNKQASANRSCRSRQDLPRGRGKVKRRSACREEGAQHSRSCSQCSGLVGQVEPSGVEPTVKTEILQVTPDRAAVSDHAPNKHTALNLIPIPDPVSDQDYDTLHPTSEQDDPGEHNQQQQVTGSKTPDEQ